MAASRSATLAKEPRRTALAVSSPNQRSTRLSQLELVGTKCGTKRGWRFSLDGVNEDGRSCCLQELVLWLKQWHNEIDPEHGARMGDYFEGFVQDEARSLGTTVETLRGWRPTITATRKSRRRAA